MSIGMGDVCENFSPELAHSRFSGQPPVEKDHPLQQAKRARFDNNRTTRAQVESLLTIEQRESISNEVRGQAQFESIGASGL